MTFQVLRSTFFPLKNTFSSTRKVIPNGLLVFPIVVFLEKNETIRVNFSISFESLQVLPFQLLLHHNNIQKMQACQAQTYMMIHQTYINWYPTCHSQKCFKDSNLDVWTSIFYSTQKSFWSYSLSLCSAILSYPITIMQTELSIKINQRRNSSNTLLICIQL